MRLSPVLRRRAGAVALAAGAVALVWLLLSGGGDSEQPPPTDGAGAVTTSTTIVGADAATGDSASELVDSIILAGFEGTRLDRASAAALEENPPGAVLIGPANWAGKGPGASLIAAIRRATGADTLIATRQEGGPYRSLADLPPEQRQIEIGDRADPDLAERWSEEATTALKRVGVDLDLAPVADVATLDSPIADRAFSDDPNVTAELTVAALDGCETAGIACAVSHFPGLGAGTSDTDQGPSSISLDAATLQGRDLVPFAAAIDAGAPAVVVSHGLYVAYDPVTPASLSPLIADDLLRGELGFSGVAISDDLSAGAIAAFAKPGPSAVRAVAAGIDLVQVSDPADVAEVRRALIAAVESGEIDEVRLSQAAVRVELLREGLE